MSEDSGQLTLPDGWESRGAQRTMFRRFSFDAYAQTRDFVDALSALTQAEGVHPQNINFARTYVNVTLDPDAAGEPNRALAARINALLRPAGA
jgi:4a-hydroxytetrahydrobiopterin dehydratase